MGDTAVRSLSRVDVLKYSQTVCDGLRDDDDGLRREVLAHAGNRWSLGVIHTLGVYGQLRHAEIGRPMHGVTQRMLTRTLRHLERDGLVVRHDFEEVVPHVEYALSDDGLELLVRMVPLWTWIVENVDSCRAARERFDRKYMARKPNLGERLSALPPRNIIVFGPAGCIKSGNYPPFGFR